MVDWQEPGSVYITSPTVFTHAVEYPESCHAERVVAVQTRLLVTEEDQNGFSGFNVERDWQEVMEALAPAIAAIPPEMPSLAEVEAMVREMEDAGEGGRGEPQAMPEGVGSFFNEMADNPELSGDGESHLTAAMRKQKMDYADSMSERPSPEAMAAMEKANACEAEGDIVGAKKWIDEAGRLGHNFKQEYGGWK